MKLFLIVLWFFMVFSGSILAQVSDTTTIYKKRVLESAEVDVLMSYYSQEGDHSAVSGGIGSEELTDVTPTIVISLPLNADDILTFDVGLSAYTSASSSNIDPFSSAGDSQGEGGNSGEPGSVLTGTPWYASSGASRKDVLATFRATYLHHSDNRNFLWGFNAGFSNEYDYSSIGFGANMSRLFNDKNTEVGLRGQVYLDTWSPIYPIELDEYDSYGTDFLNQGYFKGVPVWNQSGNSSNLYNPSRFETIGSSTRNSYSLSFSFSQILSKRLEASLFFDIILQDGLLSTPYQRIYFSDRDNYYIGNASDIAHYTSKSNTGVYHLADDIERLPDTRLKIPIGGRLNYYVNEFLVLRTYYRYYVDDWGLDAHTFDVELPLKLTSQFTLTPNYRYYTQTEMDYFAPYDTHLSTEEFYSSDYDLSTFNSTQLGLGLSYTDIFGRMKIYKMGMKNMWVKFSNYSRSDGLSANIVSFGIKFAFD